MQMRPLTVSSERLEPRARPFIYTGLTSPAERWEKERVKIMTKLEAKLGNVWTE